MGQRFFPRNKQSRDNQLSGAGHVYGHSPRQERSARDANGYALQPGFGPIVNSITVAGVGSLGVKSLVSGGVTLQYVIGGGQDLWMRPDQVTAIASAVSAGLATGFNVSSLIGELVSSGTAPYSVSADRLTLNVTLPPTASYSPGASTAFSWVFPEVAFKNRAGAITVASALVVTSAA